MLLCLSYRHHAAELEAPRQNQGRSGGWSGINCDSLGETAGPPRGAGLGGRTGAVEELRLTQAPDGSVDTSAHDPATAARAGRDDRRVGAGAAPRFPHQARLHRGARRRPARLGGRRLREARLRPLDRGLPPRARPPRRDRAPLRLPDVQAERVARHLLRGADRPRPVAGVDRRARARRASTTPSSCRSPSSITPRATTPSARCCSRRPSRPPSARPTTTSARSSATARPSASAASAAPPPRCCGSTCRRTPPACCARAELSERAYMLWDLIHDRTHMRGDLPFDPFMIRQRSPYWMYSLEELRCDLTAFADGGRARARGLRVRPPRPVRDPLRPPVPLPDHRLAGAQLRRARRPAAVRLPALARATCTGPTTG